MVSIQEDIGGTKRSHLLARRVDPSNTSPTVSIKPISFKLHVELIRRSSNEQT
jgi:hypothetical protein